MRWSAAVAATVLGLVGCATILGIDPGQPRDACPQFDVKTDPAHCGACDTACGPTEVCSAGVCKAQCDVPLTRCAGDAGAATCSDPATDPKHCGSCTTACKIADAGSLAPGPNNFEAGVPYDGGSGWNSGTPACTSSKCSLACPQGMTQCADGVCYDTQNFHDRCGSCTTACSASEWCAVGHCCPGGQMFCNNKCSDVLADVNNCGACGVACSGATPVCEGGKCVAVCTPTGSRQLFNSMTTAPPGCTSGNPCPQDVSQQNGANIASFVAPNATLVCGGTTACIDHVGIGTYLTSANCQAVWDVYCDAKKVGTISTVGKACAGSAMTNGCHVTFQPMTCSAIKLVAVSGSGTACCQNGLVVDGRITAVSAW